MRTPVDIYEKYRLMPSLQMHQLRVAAVAKMLADAMPSADGRTAILSALFHDMGNIIKSDLDVFPEFVEPQGVEYWQGVKDDFIRTYGEKTSVATQKIIAEIGLPEEVLRIVSGAGFSEIPDIVAHGPIERQICKYADMRVGPHGVISLAARIDDLEERYAPGRRQNDDVSRRESFKAHAALLKELEQTLFTGIVLRPDDITDASVAPIIEELKSYPV